MRAFKNLSKRSSTEVPTSSASDSLGLFKDVGPNLDKIQECSELHDINFLTDIGGVAGLAKSLKTDLNTGLSSNAEIEERRRVLGRNFVEPRRLLSYFAFLKDAFADVTIIILTVASIVSFILAVFVEKTVTSYAEAAAIFAAVLLVTNVTAINDWRKQRTFARLNRMVEDFPVKVLRDGKTSQILMSELVCGDVVFMEVGDILAADGVVIESSNLQIDESSLTGEPVLLAKSAAAPFLLSSTKVMEGEGLFLVTAVGKRSVAGKIRELVLRGAAGEEEEEEKSPLTEKLDRVAIIIGKIGLAAACTVFLVLCFRFVLSVYAISNPSTLCSLQPGKTCLDSFSNYPTCSGSSQCPCCSDESGGAAIRGAPCGWFQTQLIEFLHFFVIGVTILVVAVPEGLPLAVTLALAFGVMKMQEEKNLVKHLDACETMGGATAICTDKTGTLTTNRMTVVRAYFADRLFEHEPAQVVKSLGITESQHLSPEFLSLITHGIAMNSTADTRWNAELQLFDQLGNKTDCALLQLAHELGADYAKIRKSPEYALADPASGHAVYVVKSFPFSSATKKFSSVVVRLPDGRFRLFCKGASEIVLQLCTHKMDGNCLVSPLDKEQRANIEHNVIKRFADNAMRTICVAYRDFTNEGPVEGFCKVDWDKKTEAGDGFAAESALTLLGVVGIEDPLRDNVPAAIARCRVAGIDVRMVTGDNKDTAVAIAKRCGILRADEDFDLGGVLLEGRVLTGPEFRAAVLRGDKIDQDEFDNVWPNLRVLARSSPTDKFTLVSGINSSKLYLRKKELGLKIFFDRQVVAVTGDGTNDAPALKKADVGFAMGLTGTSIAKDAADIILMDDNFASILVACKWGRNIFDGVSKFLQFQLTVNVVAILVSLYGSIVFSNAPLGAVQMLWVNLIMDSFASLALATEPPTDALLLRQPYGRNHPIISSIMLWNILGQALYMTALLLTILYAAPAMLSIPDGKSGGEGEGPSQHMTLFFNTFVLMQLANQVNARKLFHELELFKGLRGNRFFLGILLVEFLGQILIVELGGAALQTSRLDLAQWIVSLVLALLVFPVQIVIVLVRRAFCRYQDMRMKRDVDDVQEIVPVSSATNVSLVEKAKKLPSTLGLRSRRNSSLVVFSRQTAAGSNRQREQVQRAGSLVLASSRA